MAVVGSRKASVEWLAKMCSNGWKNGVTYGNGSDRAGAGGAGGTWWPPGCGDGGLVGFLHAKPMQPAVLLYMLCVWLLISASAAILRKQHP